MSQDVHHSTVKAVRLRFSRLRRGSIIVMSAVLMVALLAMLSFAIDLGYMFHVRTEMQRAVDAGAMAGASVMVSGTPVATDEAYKYVALNVTNGQALPRSRVTIEFGQWDVVARRFTAGGNQVPAAIRVFAQNPAQPLFFARVLGKNTFDSSAEAVVTYLPRDIMLALDYSGSMCDDSRLGAIGKLGRASVEANLLTMYTQLGSPKYGKMVWKPKSISGNTATVKKSLGLTNKPYPYPGGSWDGYINYVMTDSEIAGAGYTKKYGYLTWMNYLQSQQQSYAKTPVLWKTSEQPITAVKDAVQLFLGYLQANSTNDRVGFSLYTASDGTAKLESALTKNYQTISDLARQRQAGHYVGGTNIYDGLKAARLELQNNGRVGAKKMVVLMTDGQATLPSYGDPNQLVLDEAQLLSSANIAVVAVSLGAGADTSLMQQVASITGGAHFNIPGGQTVAQVEAQLRTVFEQVANARPFKLVQ